jgi:hypothetical protein
VGLVCIDCKYQFQVLIRGYQNQQISQTPAALTLTEGPSALFYTLSRRERGRPNVDSGWKIPLNVLNWPGHIVATGYACLAISHHNIKVKCALYDSFVKIDDIEKGNGGASFSEDLDQCVAKSSWSAWDDSDFASWWKFVHGDPQKGSTFELGK